MQWRRRCVKIAVYLFFNDQNVFVLSSVFKADLAAFPDEILIILDQGIRSPWQQDFAATPVGYNKP